VRAGFASPQQKISKRGYDPDEVLEDWAKWMAKVDAAHAVFDSDPRRMTKGGQGQSEVAYDPETGEPITVADKAAAAPAASAKAAPKAKGETIQ
jgi:capsid protein